jgi:acetyl-CoA synthetase
MKKITGLNIYEGFGQTETTLSIATFPWMTPKPGSMGIPNPNYDIDIVDQDGNTVKTGEHGEIVIRLDKKRPLGLFKEYFRDKELTKTVITNDGKIYHTGDVAYKDEDGYFWFVGRTDDVIKSSGYRIGPFEVESACMTHPAVVECAVTGVPDPVRGCVVKATIVLAKGYTPSEKLIKEIQDHVKNTTAPYKYPRVIEFVDELPKTISGKIRRVELREKDNKC